MTEPMAEEPFRTIIEPFRIHSVEPMRPRVLRSWLAAHAGLPVRSCVPRRSRAAFILASVGVRGGSSRCSGLARRHRWAGRLR